MRIIIKLKSFNQISPFKSVYKLKNNNICQTSTLARITCMEATTISSHIRASSPRTWIHQGLERIKPIPRTIQAAIITSNSLALAKTSALIWSVNSSKSRSTSRRWRRLLMCHREPIAPKLSSHSATRQRIRRRRSRRNKSTSRRRKISIRAR